MHRAGKGGERSAKSPAPTPKPGRRRAAKRRRRLSAPSTIGGAAVLVAAVGAAAVGQTVITDRDTKPSAASTHTVGGGYVVNTAALALASRDATKISRSVTRPAILPVNKKKATQAERRALAQYRLLRHAANNAEKYAKRLSSTQWVLPTTGFDLTALYGVPGPYWASGYHTGVDFATAYGTPVVAVGNGTVVQTGWDGPYGNQVRLELPNGDQIWYNHLSAIEVTVGTPVLKGQSLGRVGNTGNSYGYHLHLEYRLAADLKSAVDPLPYLLDHGLSLG